MITIFNKHPKNKRYTSEQATHMVGKECSIFVNDFWVGLGEVRDAVVDKDGLYLTYKTNADLGITIVVP